MKFVLSILIFSMSMAGCATSGSMQLSKKEHSRLLVEAANGALNENDPTGALLSLEEAMRIDPSLPEIYHSRALAFYAKKDLPTAIFEAKKAIQLNSKYAEANNTLGKLLMESGNTKEAEHFLTLAAEDPLYRSNYKPKTNLGILFYNQGDYDKALKNLNLVIETQPQYACVAYFYRGKIRLDQAKVHEAISDFQAATKGFCANFPDAHLSLALAYIKDKNYTVAKKKLIEIRDIYPNTRISEQAMEHLRYLP